MQQVKLNIVPDGVNPIVYASQFDNGRTVRFNLIDCSAGYEDTWVLGYGDTAEAKLVKPDGTQVIASVTTYPLKNYVDMTLTRDDVDQSGVYIGEITIHSLDNIYGSLNFTLKVEFDPYDGQGVRTVSIGPADICTFETNIIDNLVECKCSIVASGGNGTPDSPIPIVGHSELNLVRCGKNLFGGSPDGNKFSMYVKAGTTLVASIKHNAGARAICYAYRKDNSELGFWTINENLNFEHSFTLTEDAYSFCFVALGGPDVEECQLEFGSTATAYEPYNGQTFTVSFGQTVYGGVYDANRGKVRITHQIIDMGDLNWNKLVISASVTGYQTTSAPTGIKPNTDNNTVPDILCDVFTADTVNRGYTGDNPECITENTFGLVTVYTQNAYADGAAFKAAMNNFNFSYPLATPIEIDVSELSVDTIVGVNNVFCDTGETELKYLVKG